MMGRVGFEPTTPDFADQRKIFAVRILMAVPRRIELRSLDRQSSIMATIRWNYTLHFTSLPYIAFSAACHISTTTPKGSNYVAGGSLSAKSVLTLLQPCFYRPFCIVSLVWSFRASCVDTNHNLSYVEYLYGCPSLSRITNRERY